MEGTREDGKWKGLVSPSDCGEHRSEFTHSILSNGGVEADNKVVLVQHVQHNLVVNHSQQNFQELLLFFAIFLPLKTHIVKLPTIWLKFTRW